MPTDTTPTGTEPPRRHFAPTLRLAVEPAGRSAGLSYHMSVPAAHAAAPMCFVGNSMYYAGFSICFAGKTMCFSGFSMFFTEETVSDAATGTYRCAATETDRRRRPEDVAERLIRDGAATSWTEKKTNGCENLFGIPHPFVLL